MRLYDWFTETSPRSWQAHSLVSLAFSGICTALAYAFAPAYWHGLAWPLSAASAAVFYAAKEWADWRRYVRTLEWHKPRWNRISPAQDVWGDLTGPLALCAGSWIHYVLQLIR